MRKITQQAKEAFMNRKPFNSSNTQVIVSDSAVALYLHGHRIAWRKNGRLYFSMCGWPTPTTRERLKAASIYLYQHKNEQFYSENFPIDPNKIYMFGQYSNPIEIN